MAPPSSPLDEPTRRRLARVLEEEAGWAPEAAAALDTAEEAVSDYCCMRLDRYLRVGNPRLDPTPNADCCP